VGPTQLPTQWVLEFCNRGVELTIQFLLIPRLRMSGDILLLYACIVWTETDILLPLK